MMCADHGADYDRYVMLMMMIAMTRMQVMITILYVSI